MPITISQMSINESKVFQKVWYQTRMMLRHLFLFSALPTPEEVEAHTLSVLEGHDNYVDLAAWAPDTDTLLTASSDK